MGITKRIAIAGLLIAAGCKHQNAAPPDLSAELDMMAPLSTDFADNTPTDDLSGVEAAICGTNTKQAEQIGVDLVVLLDTSYSMDYGLKWPEVSQALKAFLADPKLAGLGVGLQYFPIRQACSIPDYASPAVPVAQLPGAVTALTASIDSRRMSGGTPMVPAVTGILEYARTVNPPGTSTRRTVVVLATDGIPDDTCAVNGDAGVPNTIASVVAQVQAAAMETPPILTFVIGVGSDLTALNNIAAAGGGTPTAFLVDTTANTQQAFLDALNTIRKKSLVCNFEIPAPEPGLHIDFTKVNVQFTSTMTQGFVFVGSKDKCAMAPNTGWYYDDPINPTQVILCEGACDQVRESDNGRIDILFGCATLIP